MEPSSTEPEYAKLSDEELIKLAQSGDVQALNELFKRHSSEFEKCAYHLCWEEATAKDVLQEAYLVVTAKFNEFRPPHKFVPWAKKVIFNVALKFRRDAIKDNDIFGTMGAPEDINNMPEKNIKTPYDELCAKEVEQELLPVLDNRLGHLDESHKQVGRAMLECFRKGESSISLDQIAEITQIPRRSVARYRDKVRHIWKPLCEKMGFPVPF